MKYKATTNSKHNLPVADNLLNREFTAAKLGHKMVSDITYIRTDEGRLYAAAVLDLYGQRIIGLSMGDRKLESDKRRKDKGVRTLTQKML